MSVPALKGLSARHTDANRIMVKYIIYAIIIFKTHQREGERARDCQRDFFLSISRSRLFCMENPQISLPQCFDNLRDAGPSSSQNKRNVPDIPGSVQFDTVVYIQYDIVRGREAHPANGC